MTTSDTKVDSLIINKLTKQQYAQITPNENEIYLVEDDFNPDALSDLAYSGSFSDLLNKPTTISGYGITNAYTKTEVDNLITSTYKAAGSASSVATLGTLDASHEGFVYNMTADFTTTSDFVEGAGKQYYAGANVAIVNIGTTVSPVYKYDILGDFIDLSGYQLANTAVTHTENTSVGDSNTPVYINSNGAAIALSFTIAKSVPADAVFTDTVYTHPTTSGNKHIPSGGSSGQFLGWSSDGTAQWTDIPQVTVDQTYDGTSTNAQSGVAIQSALVNYVTTDIAQDITGTKTFIGQKKIEFKQSIAADKLGFTCFNNASSEIGAFEYRPNTIGSGALFNINTPYSSSDYVGFRYWGTAVNVVAPKVATAGTYYIPTHITNGSTTVTASNTGAVDISSLLPDVSGFATQTWVQNQNYLTSSSLTDYVTNSSLATTLSDYVTNSSLTTTLADYALLTDIPTVGNGTITINQGGVQKGIFTVNQSGNTTINLDTGGGTVDQTFDSTSQNAQSGTAVAEAISSKIEYAVVITDYTV